MRDGAWQELFPYVPHFHVHARGGVRQHYLDEGADRPGAPVVMVHGNPTWSFFFRDLVKAWSPTRRCLVPDHVGCGRSDRPRPYPYTLQTHIDNLDALLEAALPPVDAPDGRGRVALVVHDWGGAIGLGYAVRRPERIARLVVMNTAAWPDLTVPRRIRLCRIPGVGAFLVQGLNLFARLATSMTVEKPLPPAVREGYLAPYDSWRAREAVLRFVQDIPLSDRDPSHAALAAVARHLPALADKPMRLVWGMKDWCFSPYYLRGWRERFPQAQSVEIPDAGHYLLEDAFDRAEPAIRAFLDEPEGS